MRNRRAQPRGPKPYQPTPFAGTYFLLLTVGAGVTIALYLAMTYSQGVNAFSDQFDQTQAPVRVELLKLALASSAGIAAVAGLYVAYRKQRNDEAGSVREQDRVFTERFTAAAQLLQSEKAAVRLAGLNSLARLADDSPRDRSTCLSTICAYLRLPLSVPAHTGFDSPEETSEGDPLATPSDLGSRRHWAEPDEWEVRRSGLSLVTARLRPERPETFWKDCEVDLRDAVLVELNLSNCHIDGDFDASGAIVCGWRGLSWEDFSTEGTFIFINASFCCNLRIYNATLTGRNYFFGATFYEPIYLDNTVFTTHLSMSAVRLNSLNCTRVEFGGYSTFTQIDARGSVLFDECNFAITRPLQGRMSGPIEKARGYADLSYIHARGGVAFTQGTMPDVVRLEESIVAVKLDLRDCYVDARGVDLSGVNNDDSTTFDPRGLLLSEESRLPPGWSSPTLPSFPYSTPARRSDGYWLPDDLTSA